MSIGRGGALDDGVPVTPAGPSAFPADRYTAHGYLANPFAYARAWSDGHGGNLRSTDDAVGFGWVYPWARGATAGAQIEIGLLGADAVLLRRADFDQGGLHAPHHSALLFEYAWAIDRLACRARFVLVGEHELGVEVDIEVEGSSPESDPPVGERDLTLDIAAVGWRRDGACSAESIHDGVAWGRVDLGEPFGAHTLLVDAAATMDSTGVARGLAELADPDRTTPSRPAHRGDDVAIGVAIPLRIPVGRAVQVRAILRRGRPDTVVPGVAERVRAAIDAATRRDAEFWGGAARLEGDWPESWRRGWVYDLETTRMCIFPPGGVFADDWPSWMIQWPRAVLAEGALDCLRLSYADPNLASRAALSLFRDAPAPNVPCSFMHGEPNMVAADGSVCGTSPAWCVPFYNLERLFLRTLDRAWLGRLFPYLARYLDWWLLNRTDEEGWAVYKCTWEAGEDDTPRLDPERRGDNVVSEYVRPVELQATMALSASVLGRFADALDRPEEASRWRAVAERFATRTGELWDDAAGRFRDRDRRTNRFVESTGEPDYWGIDPCRYSALAFTPVLAGLADPEQIRRLAGELAAYADPPWTLWGSWSYVVLEAALAIGERPFASRVAAEIVGRVYDELDRRDRVPSGPTPGVAREYWPLDLSEWSACDGYGWGATTASLLVRQIFGFTESDVADGVRFRLAAALPEPFRRPGRRYAIRGLPYRGVSLDLEYALPPSGDDRLEVRIGSSVLATCVVVDRDGTGPSVIATPGLLHRFVAEPGHVYDVHLRPMS